MTARKTVTETPVDYDLDALRRAHADGHSPVVADKTFRLDGTIYKVPPRAPFFVGLLMHNDEIEEALRLWLGDKQYETFRRSSISGDEFQDLFAGVYGIDMGESLPSES